jgi:hypothetical protein
MQLFLREQQGILPSQTLAQVTESWWRPPGLTSKPLLASVRGYCGASLLGMLVNPGSRALSL